MSISTTSRTTIRATRRSIVLGGLGALGAGLVGVSTAAPVFAHGTGGTTYRRGDRGPGVASLQRSLSGRGYWCGSDDGVFGHLTKQAVWALQKRHGLVRDAIVGPKSRIALANDTTLSPAGGSGSRFEVHLDGPTSIPPYPASHGCCRLSTAAMDLVRSGGALRHGSRGLVV